MVPPKPDPWLQLFVRAVPSHLRDEVLGDLMETGGSRRDAFDVALHFQAEPYRGAPERQAAALLLAAGAGLLWLIPEAAHALSAQAHVFSDAFSRAAIWLWSAPSLLAAASCGLLVGRASMLPPHANAVRVHLLLPLLIVAVLQAQSVMNAVLAAAMLTLGAWLGLRSQGVANRT